MYLKFLKYYVCTLHFSPLNRGCSIYSTSRRIVHWLVIEGLGAVISVLIKLIYNMPIVNVRVVITTAVSRSPFSGVADNNKFFCGWQKMGVY